MQRTQFGRSNGDAESAGKPVRTPPRVFVRAFWVIHRTLYRVSGGRIGLTCPKPGRRFGMMRLDTIGRRTGRPRMAIVGYFDDGADLVTLAMNGWANAMPAWWLNLQATPETTVVLADGSRRVRARLATDPERGRLWTRVRLYPGWGADIDALAARRTTETPVVVLEPVTAAANRGGPE